MNGDSPGTDSPSLKAEVTRLENGNVNANGGKQKTASGVRGTRIGHKKSRNGCQQCKKRRVKCDEARPCRNCVRHDVKCSLVLTPFAPQLPAVTESPKPAPEAASTATPGSVGEASTSSRPASRRDRNSPQLSSLKEKLAAMQGLLSEFSAEMDALNHQGVNGNSSETFSESTRGDSGDSQGVPQADWLTDMQLVHHFTSNTAHTLSENPDFIHLWTTTVPQIAFANDFLLHGILAVSAIHLSHLNPEKRDEYTTISTRHQNIALSKFSPGLNDIGENNADAYVLHAICIFLLNTYSIAHPHGPITSKDVAQSFILLQGIKSILTLPFAHRYISNGPLARWLYQGGVEPAVGGNYATKIDDLLNLTRSMAPSEDTSMCQSALEGLKLTFAAVSTPSHRSGLVWRWAVSLPQSFLELMSQNHPMALVILMYYAALVHAFERKLWYLNGWGVNVASALDKAIQEPWREWIQWPLRCVRDGVDIRQVEPNPPPDTIPKPLSPSIMPPLFKMDLFRLGEPPP
ncbi:Sterol uptake control protein 2 [Colletotrichum sp. SAR 10_70]|nr:Sterol uptake control protein 2 [Colletotrichum sp. SAR 10_71]KAI8150876.1 Sterol uptake control protein 2 [Colletotrichum sp. SAR 10_70]KAI8171851.1 Sterol uptake control protein 2 [Colletotrichum sp. SAR 10_75]KAI8182917.1 Sterol uptake control protein 2 [Colletotrichum sp. SAR 10_65]KAI8216202.1 Sterol uptake control protein 2 [Colletotrichum sp. SAR 10_86]KAJ4994551.1 Sterol uptake control protein 2 [Colletotrichum sp. SAR 10_66]